MSFIAKKLREDRANLISKAQSMINHEDANAESIATFDNMMVEADMLKAHIDRVERAASETAKLDEIIGASAEQSKVSFAQKYNDVDRYKKGIVAQMRQNLKIGLSAEDKIALADYQNTASTTPGSSGGFLIPTDLMREIFVALIEEGGVRTAARILRTDQGNPIDMPMSDDTGNIATLVAENAPLGTGPDLVFSKATLSAYKYTSGVQTVSKELLQDSAFNFDDFLRQQLVHRFARGTNLAYTLGTGTAQPQGIATAAGLGKTGANGQVTTITYADLVDLEHSVAYPYRKNAKWMMSDAMFKSLKKLQDSSGRPLWLPSIVVGAPDSILGYNIVINVDLAPPGAGNRSLLFGDYSHFIIRDVLDLDFQILNEMFAQNGQVGFVGLMRTDSRLATVGAAIRYYANSAT